MTIMSSHLGQLETQLKMAMVDSVLVTSLTGSNTMLLFVSLWCDLVIPHTLTLFFGRYDRETKAVFPWLLTVASFSLHLFTKLPHWPPYSLMISTEFFLETRFVLLLTLMCWGPSFAYSGQGWLDVTLDQTNLQLHRKFLLMKMGRMSWNFVFIMPIFFPISVLHLISIAIWD